MELLVVISIMGILTGIMVSSGIGTNPAGARQGAITQISQSLEEARMEAVESGTDVYFGIAGTDVPDIGKRLHSFILFRQQTALEQPDPTQRTWVQLSAWQSLPQGVYFDPDVLKTATVSTTVTGLPGNPTDLQTLEFGTLGQVETDSTMPTLAIEPGVLDSTGETFIRKPGNSGFLVHIYRLTGRVNLSLN